MCANLKCTCTFISVHSFSVNGQAIDGKHAYTLVLQCSHASVGLAQARPNQWLDKSQETHMNLGHPQKSLSKWSHAFHQSLLVSKKSYLMWKWHNRAGKIVCAKCAVCNDYLLFIFLVFMAYANVALFPGMEEREKECLVQTVCVCSVATVFVRVCTYVCILMTSQTRCVDVPVGVLFAWVWYCTVLCLLVAGYIPQDKPQERTGCLQWVCLPKKHAFMWLFTNFGKSIPTMTF